MKIKAEKAETVAVQLAENCIRDEQSANHKKCIDCNEPVDN